jgi:hypothetical protein
MHAGKSRDLRREYGKAENSEPGGDGYAAAPGKRGGQAGKGSAIFLHCLGPYKPYTGGCVALPKAQMLTVMKNVKADCVVVIDSLQVLSPETWEDWGL